MAGYRASMWVNEFVPAGAGNSTAAQVEVDDVDGRDIRNLVHSTDHHGDWCEGID